MAQLAIQGHSTRGSEVIALLKMLGGKNPYGCNGLGTLCAYYIINGNIQVTTIKDLFKSDKYILYNLEGILARFPYKVGNSARLSRSNISVLIKAIKWENDEIVYKLSCDSGWWSVDNLKPYREKFMETVKITITPQCHYNEDKIELDIAKDYEIKEENGKYYAVKKQFKYPKTYKECAELLDTFYDNGSIEGYKRILLPHFQQLFICRNAYWKIAGEQMGLGKPWKPDWSTEEVKYVIEIYRNNVRRNSQYYFNTILAFPTKEMRDAFHENFKELIETCKDLL